MHTFAIHQNLHTLCQNVGCGIYYYTYYYVCGNLGHILLRMYT